MIVVIETPATLLIDGEAVAVAEMKAGASVLVDSDSDTVVYAAIKSGGGSLCGLCQVYAGKD